MKKALTIAILAVMTNNVYAGDYIEISDGGFTVSGFDGHKSHRLTRESFRVKGPAEKTDEILSVAQSKTEDRSAEFRMLIEKMHFGDRYSAPVMAAPCGPCTTPTIIEPTPAPPAYSPTPTGPTLPPATTSKASYFSTDVSLMPVYPAPVYAPGFYRSIPTTVVVERRVSTTTFVCSHGYTWDYVPAYHGWYCH